MKRLVFPFGLLLIVSLFALPARAETYNGTWTAQTVSTPGNVQLRIEYRHDDRGNTWEWSESKEVPLSELRGISMSDFSSSGQHKTFDIVRDPGALRADGWFAHGVGSGGWTFVPNGSFASELSRRGVGAPSEKQQFELAMGDFSLATLDGLLRSGFQRPSIDELASMGEHGVSQKYIDGMKNVLIQPKTVAELIRLRDHGVSADYASSMMRADPHLSGEDLVELRDHGVSSSFMSALAADGYAVSPSEAQDMRDHGVNADYIDGLRRLGYHPSASDLIRLRDHGVSVSFIERLRSHGYTHLTADDLIRLRDHGF